MVHAEITMNARTLNANEDAKVYADPSDVVAWSTIAALVIARKILDVSDDGLLQLHQAWTHLLMMTGIVLERFRESFLLAVDQNRHPSLLISFVFSLKVIRSIIAYQVEASLIVRHRLDLACKKIHARRWLRLVSMTNVEKTVFGHATTALLPNTSNLSFALLV